MNACVDCGKDTLAINEYFMVHKGRMKLTAKEKWESNMQEFGIKLPKPKKMI